jgi:WD40 repeat protein
MICFSHYKCIYAHVVHFVHIVYFVHNNIHCVYLVGTVSRSCGQLCFGRCQIAIPILTSIKTWKRMDVNYLLATVYDTTITLRSSLTYEVVGTLSGAGNRADKLAFSRDNTRIASSSNTYNRIKVWDVETTCEVAHWVAMFVMSILFSPGGEEIVSSHFRWNSGTSTFTVWNIESRLAIRSVDDISFSPLILIPCCEWKVTTVNRMNTKSLIIFDCDTDDRYEQEFDHEITDVAARPGHEQEIAVGIQNGSIVIWNITERYETKRFLVAGGGIRTVWFCFDCDGSRLFSINPMNKIDDWDVESGLVIRTIDIGVDKLRWLGSSPDGGSISVPVTGCRIIVVDVENWNVARELTCCAGPCYSNPQHVILM